MHAAELQSFYGPSTTSRPTEAARILLIASAIGIGAAGIAGSVITDISAGGSASRRIVAAWQAAYGYHLVEDQAAPPGDGNCERGAGGQFSHGHHNDHGPPARPKPEEIELRSGSAALVLTPDLARPPGRSR